jgi:hypothetical protein
VLRSSGGDAGSAARPFGAELNPFMQAAIEQLTGRTLFSGSPVTAGKSGNPVQDWIETHTPPGAAFQIPLSTFSGLPQVQLLSGPSKLYPERDPPATSCSPTSASRSRRTRRRLRRSARRRSVCL